MNPSDTKHSSIRFLRDGKVDCKFNTQHQPFEIEKQDRIVIAGDIHGNISIGTPGETSVEQDAKTENDQLAKYPCTLVYCLMVVAIIGLVGSLFNPWVLLTASILIHTVSETENLKPSQAVKLLRDITVRGHFNVVAFLLQKFGKKTKQATELNKDDTH